MVFGTVVFAMFAGFYFWWPKFTGHMLNERWGHIHFWMLFIGFHGTFLIQHWLGVFGMPRRYADYLASRPVSSEVSAVESVVESARRTGCRAHVVHLSSARALRVVAAAHHLEEVPL